jgi:hypothetical protein
MNLLSEIIRRLNQRVAVANIFDKQFGLCELNSNGNDKAWIHYIGDGQGEVVTNFDAKQGTIFWAKRGKVNISIIDSLKVSGCKKMYQTTFPLTAYAVVRKSHLPCDSEDAQDWIASRVFKLTSGMDFGFKASIGVMSYEVIPNGYANEIKSLTQNYEWACVSIDIDVQIVSSADDGCYDTCETGEIPLPPNYEPCTPCLTEVAVDGVTITGNGTVADPLVAIGGVGGITTAIAFSTDHLTVTGNGYVIGNTVWYNGNIYRCIANNDSILPTNATYWTNLGAGLQTVERPTDWDATSGNNQILNKPTIPAAQVNSDWNSVSGVSEILNKPTITTPVNADWNSVSGLSEILNKPTIPAAQIQSDWNQANNAALDFIKNKPAIPSGTVTSVSATVPAALSVAVTNPTTTPAIAITAAGVASQYIRGDGSLAPFPSVSGGGASLSYYLNGSVAQGTLGGVAFKQMSSTPVLGAGTDFTINTDGYIQSFITDASVPNQLLIPSGNWNFEMYFSSSSNGGSPRFYIELYKLSGGVLSLIASSVANPEFITNGTAIDLYTTAVAVPSTVLLAADRLAIRVYVIHSSKTITLHTEDNHLCQVITTFSTGITALNGLTDQVQTFDVGTSGTDFAISSVSSTHTFNLPTASATNRGALSSADWIAFNAKQAALGFTPVTNARTITINGTAQDLSADRSWTIPSISIFKDTTTGTASVSNTNTVSKTQLIPAGTFGNDIIQLDWGTVNKTGAGGAVVYRVYVNGTPDLVGSPQLIATYTASNVNSGARLERRLNIKSATVTEIPTATSLLTTDIGLNVLTNYNINWAADKYFVFCVQNTSGADSTAVSYYRIMKT